MRGFCLRIAYARQRHPYIEGLNNSNDNNGCNNSEA